MGQDMKKALTIIGVLIVIFSFFGCSRNKGNDVPGIKESDGTEIKGSDGIGDKGSPNSSKLIGFSYSYIGSRIDEIYTYEIKDNTFTYELGGHDEYAGMTAQVDEELLGKLKDLYIEAEGYKWDGYSKSATGVYDGSGFSVCFSFEDGQICSASGTNCVPKNFGLFSGGMEELLSPLADDIALGAKQKMIDEGFPGKVDSILVSFTQQGESGKDEYFFSIYQTDHELVNNLNISIRSVSGEFFPVDDYKYFGHLDSKDIDFSELDELIEKYQLINWYDYNVTAEDYSNAEWFQIGIGFDDDKHLSAMGTEKPENYDTFRQDFLSYMVRFIDSIKDVYKPFKN